MSAKILYRAIRSYKYQVMELYVHQTKLIGKDLAVGNDFIVLTTNGMLNVKKGYSWDGPSGPTIDTLNFMRGSLVHDALYQLMREGLLDADKDREYADDLLRDICLEDGMSGFRAWYVHKGVRLFAAGAAKRREVPRETVTAP